jgi:hypothetical protein
MSVGRAKFMQVFSGLFIAAPPDDRATRVEHGRSHPAR